MHKASGLAGRDFLPPDKGTASKPRSGRGRQGRPPIAGRQPRRPGPTPSPRFADAVLRDLEPPRAARIGRRPTTSSHSAWRLKGAVERQAARHRRRHDDPDRPAEDPNKRPSATAADRAARSVREALETLDYVRERRRRAGLRRPVRPSFDIDRPRPRSSRTSGRSSRSELRRRPRSRPESSPRTTSRPDLARPAGLRLRRLRHLARGQGDLGHGRPRRLADRRRLDLGRHPPLPPRADRGRHPGLRRLRHRPGS